MLGTELGDLLAISLRTLLGMSLGMSLGLSLGTESILYKSQSTVLRLELGEPLGAELALDDPQGT